MFGVSCLWCVYTARVSTPAQIPRTLPGVAHALGCVHARPLALPTSSALSELMLETPSSCVKKLIWRRAL